MAESIDGIPVRRLWVYASNSAAPFKRIMNMISLSLTLFLALPGLFRSRPEMVIVNSPPLPVGFSGFILSKMVRAQVIANISDIWPMSALELGAMRKGWFYSALERLENFIYRHSDAVMTQSIDTRDHVLERAPGKTTFLYRNLDYASPYVDEHPPISGQKLRIVYAGLLGVAQGVYGICVNLRLRDFGAELHIYGDGNEREKIEQFVLENPGCNIFLHDAVPKEKMPEVLSQFHTTIVPLTRDIKGAFPSKIYMAMSASLPVLFCGAGEGARFVREHGIGWVSDPRDYDSLNDQIKILARMPEGDYRSLRDHIKSLAADQFDLEDQLDRFVSLIGQIK